MAVNTEPDSTGLTGVFPAWVSLTGPWLASLLAVALPVEGWCPEPTLTKVKLLDAIRADGDHLIGEAAKQKDVEAVAAAVNRTHNLQLEAGLKPLQPALHASAYMYVDLGYVLYLFATPEARNAFCRQPGTFPVAD